MHEGPFNFSASTPLVRVFCPRKGCEYDEEMTEAQARIVAEACCPECLCTGLTFIAKARAA